MRDKKYRSWLLLLSILLLSAPIAAQQPPQRDPQAILVLTQCLNAAGGAQAFSTIQDFTATGTITYYYWAPQPPQGSATVRGRGTGQFRVDATLADGLVSWAVNRGAGSVKKVDGSLKSIPYLNAINLGSLSFPFPKVLAVLQDISLDVSYVGLLDESGHQAHHIRVRKDLPAQIDPGGLRGKANIREFFIDVGTLQLLKTLDWIHPEKQSTRDLPHEVHFSDYRLVNGVLAPFLVTENVGGARLWTLQLNQISFNTGLKDSDFQL